MKASAAMVIRASPMPMRTWTPTIAGRAIDSGVVPLTASSSAMQTDPATTDDHAAMAAAGIRARSSPPSSRRDSAVENEAAERPDDAHVEDVGAHHDEPAVLEDERLDGDDAGHDERARPGPEQHGREDAAKQVARGPADDLEVEHLGGEDEGGRHAQQRHSPLVEGPVGAPDGERERNEREQPT